MPVTKRMNQLSIDSISRESTNDSTTSGSTTSSPLEESELNAYEVARYLNHHQQQQQQHQHYLNELYSQNYNPCLSSNQNPIYYEANRVLFEAHQERITRLQSHRVNVVRS